jgi:hypothetical protein
VNQVPEARNPAISPSNPLTTDDLVLSFGFHDADLADSLITARIWWYINGIHQATHDNKTTIPASATSAQEQWTARVWVSDGKEFSLDNCTAAVTILQSSAPPSEVDGVDPIMIVLVTTGMVLLVSFKSRSSKKSHKIPRT